MLLMAIPEAYTSFLRRVSSPGECSEGEIFCSDLSDVGDGQSNGDGDEPIGRWWVASTRIRKDYRRVSNAGNVLASRQMDAFSEILGVTNFSKSLEIEFSINYSASEFDAPSGSNPEGRNDSWTGNGTFKVLLSRNGQFIDAEGQILSQEWSLSPTWEGQIRLFNYGNDFYTDQREPSRAASDTVVTHARGFAVNAYGGTSPGGNPEAPHIVVSYNLRADRAEALQDVRVVSRQEYLTGFNPNSGNISARGVSFTGPWRDYLITEREPTPTGAGCCFKCCEFIFWYSQLRGGELPTPNEETIRALMGR